MQLIYGFNPKQQIVTSFYIYIFMTLRTKLIEKSEMYPVFFAISGTKKVNIIKLIWIGVHNQILYLYPYFWASKSKILDRSLCCEFHLFKKIHPPAQN